MVYFFYAAIIVGILFSAQVISVFRHNMKVLLVQSHTPIISRNIPSPELADQIQTLSALEYTIATYIMLPFAIVCLLAVGTLPFYFQTEIPLMIAAITSAAVGLLFTYTITKDFEPVWLLLSVAMIEQIAIKEALKRQMIQDVINASCDEEVTDPGTREQILSELTQSRPPE